MQRPSIRGSKVGDVITDTNYFLFEKGYISQCQPWLCLSRRTLQASMKTSCCAHNQFITLVLEQLS